MIKPGRQTAFRFESELLRQLKSYCSLNDVSMTEVVTELVEKFLIEKGLYKKP